MNSTCRDIINEFSVVLINYGQYTWKQVHPERDALQHSHFGPWLSEIFFLSSKLLVNFFVLSTGSFWDLSPPFFFFAFCLHICKGHSYLYNLVAFLSAQNNVPLIYFSNSILLIPSWKHGKTVTFLISIIKSKVFLTLLKVFLSNFCLCHWYYHSLTHLFIYLPFYSFIFFSFIQQYVLYLLSAKPELALGS